MKLAIFVVLAVGLVLTNAAAVEDPIGHSTRTLEAYAESLVGKADEVSRELENKYDELILQPVERVEASVSAIEERSQESEVCVDQHRDEVEGVVQTFEDSLNQCSQTAATSSSSVALDIAKISIDLTYDIISLVKGVQRCRGYKNSILRKTCFANQTIKGILLIDKTRRSIEAINKSVDETLPEIFHELEYCSSAAENSAVEELENINRKIDSCVAFL